LSFRFPLAPSRRDIWHLDEVVVPIGGKKHWLWRAVDQDGYILEVKLQRALPRRRTTRSRVEDVGPMLEPASPAASAHLPPRCRQFRPHRQQEPPVSLLEKVI
jgi:DDE domain